jgi:translocation and assembly module TamA
LSLRHTLPVVARVAAAMLVLAAALGTALAPISAGAQEADGGDADPPAADRTEAEGLAYVTDLPDPEDETLAEAIAAASTLVQLEGEPAPGLFGLVRRAEADRERFLEVAHGLGWWGATVRATIAGRPLDAPDLAAAVAREAQPVQVALTMEPGPRYTVGTLDIVDAADGDTDLPVTIDRAALGLAVGDPARAEAVVAAQQRLIDQMRRQGHPFAAVPVRQVFVDHARRQMEIAFALEPGPEAAMGTVAYSGMERTDEAFLRGRVPFEPGAPYTPDRIAELRRDLASLGIFSSVRVVPGDALDAEGQLPVEVEVDERPPRFVGFSVAYETDLGFGGEAYWGHRNLFGAAERLRVGVEVGGIGGTDYEDFDFRGTIGFRKPDFLAREQSLTADLEAVQESFDAFQRTALTLGVGLERVLGDGITVGGGVSFEQSEIVEAEAINAFSLVGLPLFVRIDRSDDLLNPTEGWRLTVTGTPFYNLGDGASTFARLRADATGYVDFGTDGSTVLAGRLGLGGLFGADAQDVPANDRFYAGGGGSVRGYAFQAVGPEDASGDPAGGSSLIEGSVELRQNVTETIGLVGFLDGGMVADDLAPESEELRFGAGIGLRYYTGFGPIRADIAVPLNPDGDDDAFQFYASFGQAF